MRLCLLLLLLCTLASVDMARGAPLSGESIGAYGDSMTMQYSLWVPLATANGIPSSQTAPNSIGSTNSSRPATTLAPSSPSGFDL